MHMFWHYKCTVYSVWLLHIGDEDGMTLFGHIGEFAKGQEEWLQFVEQMEHFLAATALIVLRGNVLFFRLCSSSSPCSPFSLFSVFI